jgi:membrane fusion protein (multidrug efflux system)
VFLRKQGKAQPTAVKTGIRNRESVQVLEGIQAGDTLVTTNILRVKKGSPLKIIKTN